MIRLVVFCLGGASMALAQNPCEKLKSYPLPNTTITAAESIPAGPFQLPPGLPGAPTPPPILLPAHCRIAAVLTPSSDSRIEMEVWLPLAEVWNGKFEAVGNGGWAGTISTRSMAMAMKEGYAAASNDTGHKGTFADASFAAGHPEKLRDFADRAVHETAVTTKAIIAAFYGNGPKLSYWNGCSTGGRQGLVSAQRYPEDFDGIVAELLDTSDVGDYLGSPSGSQRGARKHVCR